MQNFVEATNPFVMNTSHVENRPHKHRGAGESGLIHNKIGRIARVNLRRVWPKLQSKQAYSYVHA